MCSPQAHSVDTQWPGHFFGKHHFFSDVHTAPYTGQGDVRNGLAEGIADFLPGFKHVPQPVMQVPESN